VEWGEWPYLNGLVTQNLDQDIVELGLFNRLVQEGSEIDLGGWILSLADP